MWEITSGRPMVCDGYAFHDGVAKRPVYFWVDRLGREWMAFHKWSWFRVERI